MSYKKEDVETWWSRVRWVQDQRPDLEGAKDFHGQSTTTQTVSKAVLEQTLNDLQKAGVVKKPEGGWNFSSLVTADNLVE